MLMTARYRRLALVLTLCSAGVTAAPLEISEKSFRCLQEMTPVRGFLWTA